MAENEVAEKRIEDVRIDKIGSGYVLKVAFLYDDETGTAFEDDREVFLDKVLLMNKLQELL